MDMIDEMIVEEFLALLTKDHLGLYLGYLHVSPYLPWLVPLYHPLLCCPLSLRLKVLPNTLKYMCLGSDEILSIIFSSQLLSDQENI